jgi:hypothetical protein
MNFKSNTLQTFDAQVTPAMAADMLAASAGNRHMRMWHVDMLAAAMVRGEWKVTHQGVAFDSNGALIDGHHRLRACQQSGLTVPFRVTVGLPPEAVNVMDTGVLRNLADLTGWDKRVAEPLRYGTTIARGDQRVTAAQVREIAAGGLFDSLTTLIEYCGSARRYFSNAPVKLAAAVTLMNRDDAAFVLKQYRALCLLDFDQMTPSAKALVRQVDSSKIFSGSTGQRDMLARALRVFDSERANVTKIQVNEADVKAGIELVRTVLLNSIGEGRPKTARRVSVSLRDRYLANMATEA